MANNMSLHHVIVLLFIAPLITSCATFPEVDRSEQRSNLTSGMVKTRLVKGKTIQAEVLEIFGAPNITTRNSEGHEVWNYHKISYESYGARKDDVYWFLQGGSRAISSTTSRSFDLIITYDKNDVVIDYKMISSQF